MSRNGIRVPTTMDRLKNVLQDESYHRSFLSLFLDPLSSLSSLPTPNTLDQKPRFFLGASAAVTVDVSTPAGPAPAVDAGPDPAAGGSAVPSARVAAPSPASSRKIDATAPKKPRRAWCKSQTS